MRFAYVTSTECTQHVFLRKVITVQRIQLNDMGCRVVRFVLLANPDWILLPYSHMCVCVRVYQQNVSLGFCGYINDRLDKCWLLWSCCQFCAHFELSVFDRTANKQQQRTHTKKTVANPLATNVKPYKHIQ